MKENSINEKSRINSEICINETKSGRKILMRAKTDLVIKKVMILSFRSIGLLPPKLFSSEETRATHHLAARFTLSQTVSVI
jgi:hypothetical protein